MKLDFSCHVFKPLKHGVSELCNCDRNEARNRRMFKVGLRATKAIERDIEAAQEKKINSRKEKAYGKT